MQSALRCAQEKAVSASISARHDALRLALGNANNKDCRKRVPAEATGVVTQWSGAFAYQNVPSMIRRQASVRDYRMDVTN